MTSDPEVERLVRVAYTATEGPIVDPDKAMTADEREAYEDEVAAVLTDLRKRYVLIPRDEVAIRTEWTNSRRDDGPGPDARPAIDEEHCDSLRRQHNHLNTTVAERQGVPARPPLRKYTRMTTIHHTPWELAP